MSHRSINFVKKWDVIQNGITKLKRILDGSPDQFRSDEYMELYTTIYNMCTQKQSQENPREVSRVLYNKYREAFEESTNDTVVCSILEKDDEFLLKEFVRRWSNHKTMVRWLSNLFSYLDRFLIKRESLTTLNEVGRSCFLQLYEQVKFRARDAVIALINNEREGEQIDKALLKNVLDIYVEIGIGSMDHYEKDFEASMLQDIGVYYSHMASIWILDYSFPDYMLKVEGCLRKEKDRVSQYLHSSSVPKLVEKVQHELLVAHANLLLEKEHSGCRALLRDNKVHDLSRMYRLYNNIPEGLELVSAIFKQHIIDTGTVLVQKAEDAASNQVLIGEIIELHDKYMAYVDGSFQNRILFNKAMHEAFEIFCDKTVAGSSCAELLASFCDNILKKSGSEKLSDEAIEETLEKVVKLLAYVSDKDLFAAFYRKKLARRLLFDRSANYEHERSMLIRLKQQFGGQFTSKMERMVTDLTLAKENQMSFEDYLLNIKDTHPRIDLSVSVLTTVYWPSYKSSDLKLPAEMARVVEVFKEFYDPKSKNRKLTWVYSLGSCHLIGKFEQKDIELIVSTYQAALLLLFNTSDRLSYNEILTQLNLPHDDLVRLLHSLSCSKYKILTKDPNTNTISETDYFEVNDKFTDRLKRIKISLPPVDPPVDERKKIVEDVDNNRRYVIDAAIVRIMKSDKVLDFQQLVSKCSKQLSHLFKPDMKAIKKRTEHLIERDYLRRDKEKKNVLEYLS